MERLFREKIFASHIKKLERRTEFMSDGYLLDVELENKEFDVEDIGCGESGAAFFFFFYYKG